MSKEMDSFVAVLSRPDMRITQKAVFDRHVRDCADWRQGVVAMFVQGRSRGVCASVGSPKALAALKESALAHGFTGHQASSLLANVAVVPRWKFVLLRVRDAFR